MESILQSSVIPGEPIEHHEHRRLLVVLALLVIFTIIIFLGLLWKATKQIDVNNTIADQIAIELKKSITEISPQQKTVIAKELSESKAISESQKREIVEEMAKISNKKF